jgi:hypothetical protein
LTARFDSMSNAGHEAAVATPEPSPRTTDDARNPSGDQGAGAAAPGG